jgi:phosphinothricin acetyltransferase
VIVRAADVGDAEAIADIYAPFVTGSITTFELEPPDAQEIARRMCAPPRMPWFVAEKDGGVVGFAYSSRYRARPAYRWSVESSVYIAQSGRGEGIGTALYQRLFDELRTLGYLIVNGAIALPNPASVALHESLGFRAIGVHTNVGNKFGAWHDVGWWQLTLGPLPEDPPEPQEWLVG